MERRKLVHLEQLFQVMRLQVYNNVFLVERNCGVLCTPDVTLVICSKHPTVSVLGQHAGEIKNARELVAVRASRRASWDTNVDARVQLARTKGNQVVRQFAAIVIVIMFQWRYDEHALSVLIAGVLLNKKRRISPSGPKRASIPSLLSKDTIGSSGYL